MKLKSIPSPRQSILETLQEVRQDTLNLLNQTNDFCFFNQAHPDFSPIGWHFGHIAFTEAYWILEYLAGMPTIFGEYQRLFAADGLPKSERQNLPEMEVIEDYLTIVRSKVLDYLAIAPVASQERLWQWLIQHECQHSETITLISQLHQQRDRPAIDPDFSRFAIEDGNQSMIQIPAGKFIMGSNAIAAQDNERPAHSVFVNTYWIDRDLVTCGEYAQFIAAGGYQRPQYWSKSGWQWQSQNSVEYPLYWQEVPGWENRPVCGVNYYEAEAYANFVGKRLPTEAEWEKAAVVKPQSDSNGCQRMLGQVWQWTSDWFAGYPGFKSYPYPGYSQVYFDQQHRVLKGGSWATSLPALRPSFRNWYYPQVRQILAGFRCAVDI